MRKILVISGSPRTQGNTELLIEQFRKGAEEAGNTVEEIRLSGKKISYCTNCDACRRNGGECVLKDDAGEIIQKALDCDVLVLATPVYFYNVTAQMKTLIDRFYAREHKFWDMPEKPVYYIICNAAHSEEFQNSTVAVLNGFVKCLRTVKLKEIIRGMGSMAAGTVKDKEAFEKAYKTGKNIN